MSSDKAKVQKKFIPVFCETATRTLGTMYPKSYAEVYIKRVHSKEHAIESAMSMLNARSNNSNYNQVKPDLRCRLRGGGHPSECESWKIFEPSLWEDIVDEMEFLLVNAVTNKSGHSS
ncbi:hypothetical protein CPC08DRAFT_712913 [Agrocybe pediades]|nr:hypothetical protein CPC08DRAFT_712913 [Agrocybe pediades]